MITKLFVMRLLLTSIIALFSISYTLGQLGGNHQKAPSWYIESLINTHHSAGSAVPEWEVQFARVRPDAVQFHSRAYAAGKELAAKYNFAFVTTLSRSGHWDDVKAIVEALSPEEQLLFKWRVNPDGSPAGRTRDGEITKHLCFYSPGIDKYIIPIYKNTTRQYHQAQYWIDHTIVTVNVCYCENCRNNFMAQYGVEPPVNGSQPYWDEWLGYHRKGFEIWMEKVCDAVRSEDENTMVTFNGAYFHTQPEPPPPFIKNLSMDVHSDLMSLCLFSRYATTVGLPFDLMPGLTDTWAGTIPKTALEVRQAAAVITANGGRWNIGEFPMSQELQPAEQMLDLADAGARQVRERTRWIQHTEEVPMVALLQSASTHYARPIPKGDYVYNVPGPTRIYWYDNLYAPNEIFGAGAAFLENNIPFDIVNEVTLKEKLDNYKILFVGDQFRLDEETINAIRQFVEEGGALLATGKTINSGLSGIMGVKMIAEIPLATKTVRIGTADIGVFAPLQIETDGAQVLTYYSGGEGFPAITKKTLGKGKILYIAGDFFSAYKEVTPYNRRSSTRAGLTFMRKAVKDWLSDISPSFGFSCTAPPWIEIAMRSKESDLLIQMVERTFEWSKDIYQTTAPVEFKMALKNYPESVVLQPGNRQIQWEWTRDTLFATVGLNEIKTHSILEIKGGTRFSFSEDTISNIPYGTRIDSLFQYLGKKPEENWSIQFVDGKPRADLKTGDILIKTYSDLSVEEFYLQLNFYRKSSVSLLGAIYLNGDTLEGFHPEIYNYVVNLPKGEDFPALSANAKDLNASTLIERPLSIEGANDHRTAKITVTAEDDTSFSLYTVRFDVENEREPFIGEPFFSQVMNGVHTGTSASGWGKGFEIFNPGDLPVSMSDYLIVNSTGGTFASVLASKDMLYKMRPGYTIDSVRMTQGIYYNQRPYPFNTMLDPKKTLVFGRGYPEGWTSTNVFRDLCDFRDTNGDLAYASSLYGFVDGARICFFGDGNSFFLIRINNDSIFNGLKSADKPDDFTLIDIFGTQGTSNNRLIEGVFISSMSATSLERKPEIWRGNPMNYGSFGTSVPGSGEWDSNAGAVHIGTHPHIPYEGHYSTVYSLVYKVSPGFGEGQTIGLVSPGTDVELFMSNVAPRVDGSVMTLTNQDETLVKSGGMMVEEGDVLAVQNGNTLNKTVYRISIQQASGNALLSSLVYQISISDSTGLIEGIPPFTNIEDFLLNITVPAGAILTTVDGKNQQIGKEKVLSDTLIVIKTIVTDSVMLEVVAEDRTTRILYRLAVVQGEPYVTSDHYPVWQELKIIDMFQYKTTAGTFLSRLVPSPGSVMRLLDKFGNERNSGDLMYKDDLLQVSDGVDTVIYNLKDRFVSKNASLRYLSINGINIPGFDPAVFAYPLVVEDYELPDVPSVTAASAHSKALVTIEQAESLEGEQSKRTATISVLAEDGFSTATYIVVFEYKQLFYSTDASLKELSVNGTVISGFDPMVKSYTIVLDQSGGIPEMPIVTALSNHAGASVQITPATDLQGNTGERTAFIKVTAEDGLSETEYLIVFELNVGLKHLDPKAPEIYGEGNAICVKTEFIGTDAEIQVYNLAGKKLVHRIMTGTSERLIMHDPEGVFIVKLNLSGKTYIKKLVL